MAKAKSAISLGISALIVIALIIVVGFGVYLNGTFNTTGTTATSSSPTTLATPTQSTRAASTDLVFTVLLNSSTVQAGQVIDVSFNLFNTLDSTNNVTGAQDWQFDRPV